MGWEYHQLPSGTYFGYVLDLSRSVMRQRQAIFYIAKAFIGQENKGSRHPNEAQVSREDAVRGYMGGNGKRVRTPQNREACSEWTGSRFSLYVWACVLFGDVAVRYGLHVLARALVDGKLYIWSWDSTLTLPVLRALTWIGCAIMKCEDAVCMHEFLFMSLFVSVAWPVSGSRRGRESVSRSGTILLSVEICAASRNTGISLPCAEMNSSNFRRRLELCVSDSSNK